MRPSLLDVLYNKAIRSRQGKSEVMYETPPLYHKWLIDIFDHPDDREWYFTDWVGDVDVPDDQYAALVTTMCLRCGEDLARYSDAEVADGLYYIFNNACSDIPNDVRDADIPIETKLEAIRSIKTLYKDCFEVRCSPVLSHLNEKAESPLWFICYMFWDITPLSYWPHQEHQTGYYEAVLDVLQFALTCSNIACIESGLHGLGHFSYYPLSERLTTITTNFINNHPHLRPELLDYARRTMIGGVQ
jgi:hypothetical protein